MVTHRAINQIFVNFEMFANEIYWPDFVNYNQNKGIQKQCLSLSTQEKETLLGVSMAGNLKYLQSIESQTFWVQLLLRAIVHCSTLHHHQYGTQLLFWDDWTHNMYRLRWTEPKANHI